jgi:UDP-N-acetylglucosamine--N-acetylmuramyl-(pentapeptide) pyrophosphoryl-undecaprenol N-acetylglucosamine transferase
MAVVGFGGYPTVPPLLAATILGAPTILHEQNAVMGRANRFLAGRVDAIATGFETLGGVSDAIRAKARHTGNPVRPAVIAAAQAPFPAFDGARLSVLVTGGSQGAKVMSDIVPAGDGASGRRHAGAHRPRAAGARRGRDAACARFTRGSGCKPKSRRSSATCRRGWGGRIWSIARSGASTVSELAVIGRPSILVPFPHAIDQDQAANAAHLAATGAALVVPQPQFTPQFLANALIEALADPQSLTKRAEAARSAGIADP